MPWNTSGTFAARFTAAALTAPLAVYRAELRDIIAVKPQDIVDAKSITELKAVRSSVLDQTI